MHKQPNNGWMEVESEYCPSKYYTAYWVSDDDGEQLSVNYDAAGRQTRANQIQFKDHPLSHKKPSFISTRLCSPARGGESRTKLPHHHPRHHPTSLFSHFHCGNWLILSIRWVESAVIPSPSLLLRGIPTLSASERHRRMRAKSARHLKWKIPSPPRCR